MTKANSNYDVIVVGGGPAGTFFAYEMVQRNPDKKILLIDRGKRVEERHCPEEEYGKCTKCKLCSKTNGFSGAGAFSDGKLSLYNPEDDDFYVGGNLHKYIGVDATKKLIDYTDDVYLKFGATTKLEGTEHKSEIAKIRKATESVGMDLINIPIRHLGTDKSHDLYKKIEDYLEDSGIDLMFDTEAVDLVLSSDNEIRGVKYKDEESSDIKVMYAANVVIAVGRVGSEWLLNMCNKHNIESSPAIIDIGIRYELPDEVMKSVNEFMYEGKFVGKPNPFNDKVRTFCQNPSGFVATEAYDGGLSLVNGHSCKEIKSSNTNMALLVSLNLNDMDPIEYSKNIGRLINALAGGQVMVQRLGDILNGKRTWPEELEANTVKPTLKSAVPGDLSLGIPNRILKDIINFIKQMDNVIPGFAAEDNLLYGLEAKFYSNKLDISSKFETNISGLYAIGDGCGLTRGLMMASASGVELARKMFE